MLVIPIFEYPRQNKPKTCDSFYTTDLLIAESRKNVLNQKRMLVTKKENLAQIKVTGAGFFKTINECK